jgi:hypothetical protein
MAQSAIPLFSVFVLPQRWNLSCTWSNHSSHHRYHFHCTHHHVRYHAHPSHCQPREPLLRVSCRHLVINSLNLYHTSAFKQLAAPYLDEMNETIIPVMYHLHRGLGSLMMSTFATPAFNAPDRSGTSIQVEGKIIHLSAIKAMVQCLHHEIGQDLHRLTFGLGPCDRPTHVYDSLRETKAGYSFLDDLSIPFASQSNLLLRAVLTDRITPIPYFLLDSHNKVLWLPGPCYEYLNLSYDVMMKLFVVTHITSGSPGQGSELASQLLRNISGGSSGPCYESLSLLKTRSYQPHSAALRVIHSFIHSSVTSS